MSDPSSRPPAQEVREEREAILDAIMREEPRLLRVARIPSPERPARSRGVLLTFDVGRLLVQGGTEREGLRIAFGEVVLEPPEEVTAADQDDPWWAVIGNELVHAWAVASPDAERAVLELQFRKDDANPKLVVLTLRDADIRVTSRPKRSH